MENVAFFDRNNEDLWEEGRIRTKERNQKKTKENKPCTPNLAASLFCDFAFDLLWCALDYAPDCVTLLLFSLISCGSTERYPAALPAVCASCLFSF